MKIIDLLNKIANGEEVPEKFRFAGQVFERKGSYIEDEDGDSIFESMFFDFSNINDEVEIIEEDKKIEKIEKTFSLDFINSNIDEESKNGINLIINELINKVDKLIDEVNKLKGSDE